MDEKEVLERIKADQVVFINLQFTDIHGRLKEITAPVNRLEDILRYGAWFDGSSIEGFARIHESDLYLKPDPSTYSIVPWLSSSGERTARLICDIYRPDGGPFEGDPRYILKKALEKARKMGFEYNLGPELEFYLFKGGDEEKIPIDQDGYFDLASDKIHEVSKEITACLETFGIEVEAMHHEVGPGQYEIDFRYGNASLTSDRLITLRATVRAITQRKNLRVTFMPKPIMGIAGSGMHVHQSLFDLRSNRNAFYDQTDKYRLSKTAYSFMAGQLYHIKGMMPILCPTVNSYKRLITGFEAPVYISWARINRSALMRVPQWFEDKSGSARIELRCPDPACNPYLSFAVMLEAGLDGIEKNMRLPLPVEEDLYSFDEDRLREMKIDVLPSSLFEALEAMKEDKMIEEVLGEHLYTRYLDIKLKEWNEFKMQVTRWEIKKYFDV